MSEYDRAKRNYDLWQKEKGARMVLEAELRGEDSVAYSEERADQKVFRDRADAKRDHAKETSLARWTPQRCSLWGGVLASIVAVETLSGLAWLLYF